MTDLTFDKGMVVLMSAFPSLALTKGQIKAWRVLLSDLPDDGFMAGVVKVCQSRTEIYPGTNWVALIREGAADPAEVGVSAEEAWTEVRAQMRDVGLYGVPAWSTPEIKRAVTAIGWRDLCVSTVGELSVQRAHFMRIYGAFMERIRSERVNKSVRQLLEGRKLELTEGGAHGV